MKRYCHLDHACSMAAESSVEKLFSRSGYTTAFFPSGQYGEDLQITHPEAGIPIDVSVERRMDSKPFCGGRFHFEEIHVLGRRSISEKTVHAVVDSKLEYVAFLFPLDLLKAKEHGPKLINTRVTLGEPVFLLPRERALVLRLSGEINGSIGAENRDRVFLAVESAATRQEAERVLCGSVDRFLGFHTVFLKTNTVRQ